MAPPKINEHQRRKRRSLCQPIPAGRKPGSHLMWEGSDKCNSTDGHTGHGTGASLTIHSMLTHTHACTCTRQTDPYCTLAYYIGPVAHLLPEMCQRLSQTARLRTCTHASSDRTIGGGGRTRRPRRTEDRARTQTSLTTGRKLSRATAAIFSPILQSQFPFSSAQVGRKTQRGKQTHNEKVK